MSKLISPGAYNQFTPDSSPRLPGCGAKKHAEFNRFHGSFVCVYGSHPFTYPIRAPSYTYADAPGAGLPASALPVMFCVLTPEIVNVGVNGAPEAICVTPEICQPFVNAWVTILPSRMFGRLTT